MEDRQQVEERGQVYLQSERGRGGREEEKADASQAETVSARTCLGGWQAHAGAATARICC